MSVKIDDRREAVSPRRAGSARSMILVLVVLGAVGFVDMPAAALASTLYVDRNHPACSDTGPGSAATPFCTINKGATVAVAGQTVQVASGSYVEKVTVAASGTPSAPIVLRAAPGAGVNLTSSSQGFVVASKSWVTIEGFNVAGTTNQGVYVNGSSHVSILDNHVSYSGLPMSSKTKPGIYVNGSDSLNEPSSIEP